MPIENNIETKENTTLEKNISNNQLADDILKEINKTSNLENLENLDKSKNVNSNNVNSNNVIYQKDSNFLKGVFIIIFTLLILILLFFVLAYMNGGDLVRR